MALAGISRLPPALTLWSFPLPRSSYTRFLLMPMSVAASAGEYASLVVCVAMSRTVLRNYTHPSAHAATMLVAHVSAGHGILQMQTGHHRYQW
jgi:hypothetical protein